MAGPEAPIPAMAAEDPVATPPPDPADPLASAFATKASLQQTLAPATPQLAAPSPGGKPSQAVGGSPSAGAAKLGLPRHDSASSASSQALSSQAGGLGGPASSLSGSLSSVASIPGPGPSPSLGSSGSLSTPQGDSTSSNVSSQSMHLVMPNLPKIATSVPRKQKDFATAAASGAGQHTMSAAATAHMPMRDAVNSASVPVMPRHDSASSASALAGSAPLERATSAEALGHGACPYVSHYQQQQRVLPVTMNPVLSSQSSFLGPQLQQSPLALHPSQAALVQSYPAVVPLPPPYDLPAQLPIDASLSMHMPILSTSLAAGLPLTPGAQLPVHSRSASFPPNIPRTSLYPGTVAASMPPYIAAVPQAPSAMLPASADLGAAHALPDYMLDPDAVLRDNCVWRKGRAPDYSVATNKYIKEHQHSWPARSLEQLVSNLVKNWEKEASHKLRAEEWRTCNMNHYSFSTNGGPKYTSDEMIVIGTYNALIGEHAYYSAQNTGFEESHAAFRDAMPTGFAWEVVSVMSGPPRVTFKWRHWGTMTGKLVCPLGQGRKLEAEPTYREVEIFGMCMVDLDDACRITNIEVYYDPHQLLGAMVEDFCPLASKATDSKFIIDVMAGER